MKRTLATISAIAVSVALASAAQAQPFSGPYIGADFGYDTGSLQTHDHEEGNGSEYWEYEERGRSVSGIAGGVFVGYDARLTDNIFGGVEVRAGYSDANFDMHSDYVSEDNDTDDHYHITYRARESFSATARLGYLLNDKTGLYVRGGVAKTKLKASNDYGFDVSYDPIEDEFGKVYDTSDNNIGLVLGAGLETSLSNNLALRIEYNLTNYGNVFDNLTQQMSAADTVYYDAASTYNFKFKTQQARVGLSYRF